MDDALKQREGDQPLPVKNEHGDTLREFGRYNFPKAGEHSALA